MAQEILIPAKLDPSSIPILVKDIASIKPPPINVPVNLDTTSLQALQSKVQSVNVSLQNTANTTKSISSQMQQSVAALNTAFSDPASAISNLNRQVTTLQNSLRSLSQSLSTVNLSQPIEKAGFSLDTQLSRLESFVTIGDLINQALKPLGKCTLLSGKCAQAA